MNDGQWARMVDHAALVISTKRKKTVKIVTYSVVFALCACQFSHPTPYFDETAALRARDHDSYIDNMHRITSETQAMRNCATQFGLAHAGSSLTASELADAAVSSCDEHALAVTKAYAGASAALHTYDGRSDLGEYLQRQSAEEENLRHQVESEARNAVLIALANVRR